MFCPNCGSNNSDRLNFCRSCGLGLEKVSLALAEQKPSQLSENLRDQKERFEKLGVGALAIFGTGIVGILLYLIIYRLMILQGRTWEGAGLLGLMVLLSFGLIAVYMFAKASDVGKGIMAADPSDGNAVNTEPAAATRELLTEARFEPIPSAVEHTTELLRVKGKARP